MLLGFNFDNAARLFTLPGHQRPIWPIPLALLYVTWHNSQHYTNANIRHSSQYLGITRKQKLVFSFFFGGGDNLKYIIKLGVRSNVIGKHNDTNLFLTSFAARNLSWCGLPFSLSSYLCGWLIFNLQILIIWKRRKGITYFLSSHPTF